MNYMIHSAEMIHRQRAAEVARNAEFARRRAERTSTEAGTYVSLAARVQRVLSFLAPRNEALRTAMKRSGRQHGLASGSPAQEA